MSGQHDPRIDDLLQALASPARADELAGQDAAVAAMRDVLADGMSPATSPTREEPTTVHASPTRRARIATIVAASVIGVGAVAAAAPPDFVPGKDGPSFFDDPRTHDATRGVVAGQVPWMRAITDTTDLRQAVAEARGTGPS